MAKTTQVKWITVAPLHYYDRLPVPFKLAKGVILTSIPNWVKSPEFLDGLALDDQKYLSNGRYALLKEYKAKSLGDPDPEWKGKTARSKQQTADELIKLANLALWLANPSAVGFSRIIVADYRKRVWSRVQFGRDDPLRCHKRDSPNPWTKEGLTVAKRLHSALARSSRDGAVWIAARTLWKALQEQEWQLRYPLMWIVLEALFGPDDPRETTYRLSQRLAFFLAGNRRHARQLFDKIKAGYAWRSRVVHGMRLRKLTPQMADDLMYDAEAFARNSLSKVLSNSEWLKRFNGKDRDKYLDEFLFAV